MRHLLFIVAIALSTAALAQLDDSFAVMNNTGSTLGWDSSSNPSAGGGSAEAPLIDDNVNAFGSGPGFLNDQLVFAGGVATLVASVDARDISGSTWPLRGGVVGTMAEAGGGSSPTTGRDLPFTESTARGVLFGGNGNKFYDAGSSGIGTDDYIFEWFGKVVNTSFTHTIISDYDGANGWSLEYLSSGNMRVLHGSGTPVNVQFAVPVGSYNHVMCFGDRSTNIRCDVNGALGGQIGINGQTGSVNNANGFQIGGSTYIGATGTGGETDSFARVWKCTNCINTAAEQDALAQARAYAAAGITPSVAVVSLPIFARATTGYVDIDRDGDGTRRLYLMGSGWPRVGRRNYGGMKNGWIDEPVATNNFLQTTTLDNVSWTKNSATIAVNAIASPESGDTSADGIIGAAAATNHYVEQAPTLTAATWTQSVFVKAGTGVGNKAALILDSIGVNGVCVNLSTCAQVGAVIGAPAAATFENYGAGWCRVGMTWTATAVSTPIRVYAGDDTTTCTAGAQSYTGDGATVDVYAWVPQVETLSFATSPIVTTSATVTRNGEDLRFDPLNTTTTNGTLELQFVLPTSTLSGGIANPRLAVISDNSGTAPGVFFDPNSSNEARCEYYASAAVQAQIASAVTGYADGALHKMRISYTTNDVRCFFDDAQIGATDTVATMQAGATTFYVGRSSGGGQLGFFFTRWRVFGSIKTAPGAIP